MFTITAYDQPSANGDALSSGTLSVNVTTQPLTVPVTTMVGTVEKVSLGLENSHPPAGTARTVALSVQAFDASGATILGAYAQPIRIQDADTTGHTKLSTTSLTSSSSKVTLSYDGKPLSSASLTATTGTLSGSAVFAPEPTVIGTYPAPTVQNGPFTTPVGLAEIYTGPDGSLWSTGASGGAIVKIGSNGAFSVFPLDDSGAFPTGLATGSDGRIWFAQMYDGAIGAITTTGTATVYSVPAGTGFSQPAWVTRGSDGNIWAVDQGLGALLRVTPDGVFTSFPLPNASSTSPNEIITGPDGNLWVTDMGNNAIEAFTTTGQLVASYALPNADAEPWGITVGPDKNLWFTEFQGDRIGRITTAGQLSEFNLPTALAGPLGIVPGPDGNIWFTESGGSVGIAGKIGYITPNGKTIREYPMGDTLHAHDLVFDANGMLWVTEFQAHQNQVSTIAY